MKKSILVKITAAIFAIGAAFPLGAFAAPASKSTPDQGATKPAHAAKSRAKHGATKPAHAPRKHYFAKDGMDSGS
jgi:hypothetical protein